MPNHLVTIPEARPFSATGSIGRNGQFAASQKKNTVVKTKEILGSNLIAEIEETMKTLLKPTKEHRAKVLQAILGSRGARECIHHYRDNDVTSDLTNTKQSGFAVYRKEMGPTIAPIARRAPPPYKYKKD